jgi:predicted transcriptional regulator
MTIINLERNLDNTFFLINLNWIINDLLQHYLKMFNKIQVFIGNMNVVFLKAMILPFKLSMTTKAL